MSNKQIIFISCGQRTEEEKQLGKEIQSLVRELTPFEPYFAELQHSLSAITKNIFEKLHNAAGFISVMHHRGDVTIPNQKMIRASVWIEQEIAIASFMEQVLHRQFNILCFIQDGITNEGVREYLHLNPISFVTHEEIFKKLRRELPDWKPIDSAEALITQETMFTDFHSQRIAKIVGGKGAVAILASPKIIFHLSPTSILNKHSSKADVTQNNTSWQMALKPMCVNGWDHGHNKDGVFNFKAYKPEAGVATYVQLFRDGKIEVVDATGMAFADRSILESLIEKEIIESAMTYLKYFEENLHYNYPFLLQITLTGINGFKTGGAHKLINPYEKERLLSLSYADDDLILPCIKIDRHVSQPELCKELRPMFDRLWQATGWPRSMSYDENGTWNPW